MKRSIFALALAAVAAVSFAEDRHPNSALKSQEHSVAKQQLADAEEWLRSRPGGYQESTGDSSNRQS
jgi:hypothetical protein